MADDAAPAHVTLSEECTDEENDLHSNCKVVSSSPCSLARTPSEDAVPSAQPLKRRRARMSSAAERTVNPIRAILERPASRPPLWCSSDASRCRCGSSLPSIALGIGDPTAYAHLPANSVATAALVEAATSQKFNGYAPSKGLEAARGAVAQLHMATTGVAVSASDVVLCSGASHALQLCITALAEPGVHNVVLPRPGFALYRTICEHLGVTVREYTLLAEQQWEVDLAELWTLIDDNTAAVLINNPSNPCGSVFSRRHLRDVLGVCESAGVAVISDEVYDTIVFDGVDGAEGGAFVPAAAVAAPTLPLLTVNSVSKRFLLPGWRLGWIVLSDGSGGSLGDIRVALERLSALIVGANTLVQAALPQLLQQSDAQWHNEVVRLLASSADRLFERVSEIPSLRAVRPRGGMFVMVDVRATGLDDLSFVQR